MTRHTLSVLVEDQPGVLARIASLFSRRGFNIESLAVGPTEHEGVSRMTIVVNVAELPLEQVTKQLNKLINVLKIVELDPVQLRFSVRLCSSRFGRTARLARKCWRQCSCSGQRLLMSPRTPSSSRPPEMRTSLRRCFVSLSHSGSRSSCSRAWWRWDAGPARSPIGHSFV